MFIQSAQVRNGADQARTGAEQINATRLVDALSAGADAVPGGELATALDESLTGLGSRVRAFREAVRGTTDHVDAAVAAYAEADAATSGRLTSMTWRVV